MSNQTDTFYNKLNSNPGMSRSEIQAEYWKLAKQFHSDVSKGDQIAEAKMRDINEAFQVLGNEKKRAEYDGMVNVTETPKYEGGVTQTETKVHKTTSTENATPMPEYESETRMGYGRAAKNWADAFAHFSAFGGGEGNVTDWAEGQKPKSKVKMPDFKPENTEKGFIFAFGKLELSKDEFNLLSGLTDAFREGHPTTIECGKYKITLGEEVGDFKIQVRLDRFKETAKDISVKTGEFKYEIKPPETYVDVNQIDPTLVIGAQMPVYYKELLEGVINMATDIAANKVIDGNDIVTLNRLSRVSFSGEGDDVRTHIEAKKLKNEVNRNIAEWKIVHEGGIKVEGDNLFAKRASVKMRV